MSASGFARFLTAPIVVWFALQGGVAVYAQDIEPVNSGANPYRKILNWGIEPEGRPWGRLKRRGHRPRRQVGVGGRPLFAGTTPGCVGTKVNPVHHFDENGKRSGASAAGMFVWPHGIHVDRDGNVWVTDARAPSPTSSQAFPGEEQQGQRGRQVQPRGQGAHDAREARRAGNPPEALTDPTDVVTDPRTATSTWPRATPTSTDPESDRAHLGVRQEREVPQDDRQDRNGAGRVPDAARARVRFPGPADRRRPPQPSHPDPDEGREVRQRIRRLRPHQRAGDRQERRHLHGRLGVDRKCSSGLAQRDPDRQPQGRQGDDLHSAAHDAEFADGAMGEGIAIDAAGNIYTAEATIKGIAKHVKN